MSDYIIFSIVWIVLSAVGEFGVTWAIDNYPLVMSTQGAVSDDAVFFLLRWTVPIFMFVVAFIGYAMVGFYTNADDTSDSEHQYKEDLRFSWGWLVITAILNLIFIIHPGVTGLQKIWASNLNPPKNTLDVQVTGQQWHWSFSYPQYGIKNASTLVLPVNRTDKFDITSMDVIHSFWIPAFRLKKAAIPGETRVMYQTPTEIGSTASDPMLRVQCAQVCGAGHSYMRAEVKVVSAQQFQEWVKKQKSNSGG